jgi:prepilin-type N-terminal cleavage/methylation domain-containing protein
MRARLQRSDDGFTLIEVLISFVIMAGAIVMAFQVFGDGLRGIHSVQLHATSVAIARTEIDRIAVSEHIVDGTTTGTAANQKWRIVIRDIKNADPQKSSLLHAFKIEAYVGEGMQGTEPLLETIIVAKPASP